MIFDQVRQCYKSCLLWEVMNVNLKIQMKKKAQFKKLHKQLRIGDVIGIRGIAGRTDMEN